MQRRRPIDARCLRSSSPSLIRQSVWAPNTSGGLRTASRTDDYHASMERGATVEEPVAATESSRSHWLNVGTTMFGVAALVSFAFAAWTLLDLARNFHDDAAVRLLPDLFRWLGVAGVFATVWGALRRGPSQPISLWARWLVVACAGVVVFLVGAYLLARPLDLGRYEAYCQPLLVESIPGSENPARCADGGRLALGLLLVGVGVSTWIGRSRALSRTH